MSMPFYEGGDKLARLRARHTALKQELERSQHRALWQELNDYILPHKIRYRDQQRHGQARPLSDKVLDSTAKLALNTVRSGMMSGITNPARPWFRLSAPDPDMNSYGPVKQWLYEVQQRLEWMFARSNLYKVLPSVYEAIACFGTTTLAMLDDFEDVRRYDEFPLGSFTLALNYEGRIDSMFRDVPMTVRQVVQMFGEENCSEYVKQCWGAGRLYEWVWVAHAIAPNEGRDITSAYAKDKRFASCWWEENTDSGVRAGPSPNKFLRESGFDRYPLLHPRWETSSDSPYGHSAGMDVLPDVKQLQFQQEKKLKAIDKIVDPPTQGPPMTSNVNAFPGGHNTLPMGAASEGIRSIYDMTFPLNDHKEDMAETRVRISRGFFEDVFRMLANIDRAQITAYEIAERKEEKLLMLGPVLQTVNDDLLDPLIDDAFYAMNEGDLLPPPPPELVGKPLRVEYISVLHQAMRAVGTAAIDRLLTTAVGMAQTWPEAIDKINPDEVIDEMGERLGTPPKIVRGEDEVDEVRQARQQQQTAMAMAQAAPGVGKAIKDVATAPAENTQGGESVLSRALGLTGAA